MNATFLIPTGVAVAGMLLTFLAARRGWRKDTAASQESLAATVNERMRILLDESRRDLDDLRSRIAELRKDILGKDKRIVALEEAAADCQDRVEKLMAMQRKR